MSPTSAFPLALNLSSVAEELEDLEVLRYLSGDYTRLLPFFSMLIFVTVSALSALIWDTILLLRYECRAIWKNAPIILRVGYAINKYGAILNLITLLIGQNKSFCNVMGSHLILGITPLGVISETGVSLISNV